MPRAGDEREKAEHRGRPPDGRERFRIDEDAGGDTGGDGDGEDDGCNMPRFGANGGTSPITRNRVISEVSC